MCVILKIEGCFFFAARLVVAMFCPISWPVAENSCAVILAWRRLQCAQFLVEVSAQGFQPLVRVGSGVGHRWIIGDLR